MASSDWLRWRLRLLLGLAVAGLLVLAAIDVRLVALAGAGLVVGAAILALSSLPALGAYALAAAISFEAQRLVPSLGSLGTVPKVVGAVVVVGWSLALLRRRARLPTLRRAAPILLAAAFVAWAAVTLFWSEALGAGATRIGRFVLVLLSAVIVASVINSRTRLERFAVAQVVFAATVGVISIVTFPAYNALTSPDEDPVYPGWRGAWLLGDPNDFAGSQVVAFSIALGLAAGSQRRYGKLAAYGAAGVIASSILVTLSRGGILSLIVVTGCWLVSGGRRALVLVPMFAVVAAVGFVLGLSEPMLRRLELPASNQRWVIWDVAFQLWQQHPLAGLGLGSFSEAFAVIQMRSPLVAHNMLLGVAVETGVIGLLLWMATLVCTLLAFWQLARSDRNSGVGTLARGYAIGLIGFLVTAFFLSAELAKVLWLMIGLASAKILLPQTQRQINIAQRASVIT
jgi:O-antigen ligase